MNVDTGQFQAITDAVAALTERVDRAESRLRDVARLHEIVRPAGMTEDERILARTRRQGPPPDTRPRHLRPVQDKP